MSIENVNANCNTALDLLGCTTDQLRPQTADQLRERMRDPSVIHSVACDAIDRVAALERALLPFAVRGVTALHMRRLLNEAGRDGEPAAGVFISCGDDVEMLPVESDFYQAILALGREHVREKVLINAQAISAAN